jgi:hypothetical protein
MLQHTGWFWPRISYQRTMWYYWSIPLIPWPGSSWFLPVPSTEIRIEGTALLWFYWHNWDWQKSWKGCHQITSRNVSNTFTITSSSVYNSILNEDIA